MNSILATLIQGTLKGLLPEQMVDLDCRIMLSNTYHLGNRPGVEVLEAAGGLHKFMGWNRSLLTDSGGFQMVSLLKLAEITEEGVNFESPYDGSKCMLTPERSMEIQHAIGADIMMQLDDVVDATNQDPDRFEEARHRTVRWLDRCIKVHDRKDKQNLFPIVQVRQIVLTEAIEVFSWKARLQIEVYLSSSRLLSSLEGRGLS